MASILADLALGIAGSALEHGIEYAGKSLFNKIAGKDDKEKEKIYETIPVKNNIPQNFKLPPVKVDVPSLDMRLKRTPPPSIVKPLPLIQERREPVLEMEEEPYMNIEPNEPILLGNPESRNILGYKQAIFYV